MLKETKCILKQRVASIYHLVSAVKFVFTEMLYDIVYLSISHRHRVNC